MAHVLIAAAHKSSGKTTVTLGLARALRDAGLVVQTFKKGPDYIDPMWHARAGGRPCYNLDFNTQEPDEIRRLFAAKSAAADVAIIEANKGLYDGVDLEGSDSNAALAKLIAAPVILVVDTEGITRGIAPLLLGYRMFDLAVRIAGVVLNKVAGPRHAKKLREAVARYSDLPVLGCLRRDERLTVRERHLGLTTPSETDAVESRIALIADAVRDSFDLEAIRAIAGSAPPVAMPSVAMPSVAALPIAAGERVRIAVARDTAFGFYYPDDLEALADAGADLVFFDTLHDRDLPAADGLLIGGGFPEMQIGALAANAPLRTAIRRAIEGGLPAYAECGGLMYMCRSIAFGDETGEMVGVVPGDAVMHPTPQGRGQVRLVETAAAPWPAHEGAGGAGWRTNAHEFHYAGLRHLPDGLSYGFDVVRGDGIDGKRDGVVVHNLLATFSHQRDTSRNPWARRFVAFVRRHKVARAARGSEPALPPTLPPPARQPGSRPAAVTTRREPTMTSPSRFDRVIAAIDAANASDPRSTIVDGLARPYEVVYAERMTARLAAMYPDASEALRIAARAQHIRRWDIPRDRFPEGRAGYNDWRRTCREHHAALITAIMTEAGYASDDIARVVMMVKKEQLKKDRDSQALENVVDVVFVEHYIDEFLAKYSSYDEEKVLDIIGKTLRKMSPKGHQAALALDLPDAKRALILKAVEREAETLAKLAAVAVD